MSTHCYEPQNWFSRLLKLSRTRTFCHADGRAIWTLGLMVEDLAKYIPESRDERNKFTTALKTFMDELMYKDLDPNTLRAKILAYNAYIYIENIYNGGNTPPTDLDRVKKLLKYITYPIPKTLPGLTECIDIIAANYNLQITQGSTIGNINANINNPTELLRNLKSLITYLDGKKMDKNDPCYIMLKQFAPDVSGGAKSKNKKNINKSTKKKNVKKSTKKKK